MGSSGLKSRPTYEPRVMNHVDFRGQEYFRNIPLAEYLNQVAKEKGYSYLELSRVCGFTVSLLRVFFEEGYYTKSTLRSVMQALYQDEEDVAPYLKIKR